MRKSTLISIPLLAIVFFMSFGRFHYSKDHLSGSYYFETYFLNNDRILYKSGDGRFIPVLDKHIKGTTIVDSILFVTRANGDSLSYFIIDMRKDFDATNRGNVLGPLSREKYEWLCSNPPQLTITLQRHN